MEVQVTQTNATMCFILLHGPSCDQQQKKKDKKGRRNHPQVYSACSSLLTSYMHIYIVLLF